MSFSTDIATLHNLNGGSTYRPTSGAVREGYALSVFPEFTERLPGKEIDPLEIEGYAALHADVLNDPRAAIGTWFNQAENTTYLDIATVTPDREAAISAAKRANQIAVFNLNTFEEIPTGGTGLPIDLPTPAERLPYIFGGYKI